MLDQIFPVLSWLLTAALLADVAQVPTPPNPVGSAPVSAAAAAPDASPAAPPAAPDVDELADFRAAEVLYIAGKLREAMGVYQQVFLRTGEPACLANIGRLYEEQGEVLLAAEHYRRFLLHPRTAEGQKAQVRARLIAIAPPSIVAPDERRPVAGPAGPGAPSQPRVEHPAHPLMAGGAVLIGLGTPGLVAGGVLAGQVQGLHDELRRGDFETADQRAATEDEAARKRGATLGLLICGGLAVVAGVAMLIGGARRAAQVERQRRVSLRGQGLVVKF